MPNMHAQVYYATDLRFDQPFKDVLEFDDDKPEVRCYKALPRSLCNALLPLIALS